MLAEDFFNVLWQDYLTLAPQAKHILKAFENESEAVANDHVAFRTFANSPIDLGNLEPAILAMGYQPMEDYKFTEKKLTARSYIHSSAETPKIFLSQLEWSDLSSECQKILKGIIEQIPNKPATAETLFAGKLWAEISFNDYQTLTKESEYAAWLCAHGLHANHFTVAVHHLSRLKTLSEVNRFVESIGYELNKSGGEIKGAPEVYLEQSSTMASRVSVMFSDGEHTIPGCFYEFAMRYPYESGKLFQGFIEGNANKIFESTNQ